MNTESQKNCGTNQISIIEICFCILEHEWVINNDIKQCRPICGTGTQRDSVTNECVCSDGYADCPGLNNRVPVPPQPVHTVELFKPSQQSQAASGWVAPVANTFSEISTKIEKIETPSADLVSVKDWVDPSGVESKVASPSKQEQVEPVEQQQPVEEVAPQEPVENNAGSTFMNGKSLFADISYNSNTPVKVKYYSETATESVNNTDNTDSSSSDED